MTLMSDLAKLLDAHGAHAVLEAMRSAADSCADIAEAPHNFTDLAEIIQSASQQARFVEASGDCTLAMGAEVLADIHGPCREHEDCRASHELAIACTEASS